MDAFAAGDGAAVFRAVNRVIEGGHEPRRFAIDMLDRFRDLIVLASVPDAITTGLLDVPPDRAEALTAQASRSGLAALTRAAEIISAGLDQMRGATSPRLLLELMCAQVLLPAASTDERSVLTRLERLESGAVNDLVRNVRARLRSLPLLPSRPGLTARRLPSPAPCRTGAAPGGWRPPSRRRGAGCPGARWPGPAVGGAVALPRRRARCPPVPLSVPPPSRRPGAAAAAAPAGPRGAATAETLRQGWDGVLEALKAKRRVAWMLLSNASVVSLDEGVLTLRFPRQGDVKGFQSSGYEDLLKQVLQARFGVNVVVRAVSGGDPPPGERRRQGPGPVPPPPASPAGQPAGARPGEAPAAADPPADPPPVASRPAAAEPPSAPAPPADGAGRRGGGTGPFGISDLPPPPDEEFDPDDEGMAVPAAADLTGMALVQRELGAQIIAEYED